LNADEETTLQALAITQRDDGNAVIQISGRLAAVGNLAIDALVDDQTAIDSYLAALGSSSQD